MSTRSGKRIHSSFHENTVKLSDDILPKSERKTRSKRLKENCEDVLPSKTKKFKNYVSFPKDEDFVENTTINNVEEKEIVSSTLKEKDLNVSVKKDGANTGKTARLTRRTKKFAENTPDETLEGENVEEITKIKKKGKKSKSKKVHSEPENEDLPEECVEIVKKTKKKKGKKLKNKKKVQQEPILNSSLNKSKESVDSFHSAAGSPVKEIPVVESIKLNGSMAKSPRRASKRFKPDYTVEPENLSSDDNNSKKRKLSTNNTSKNTSKSSLISIASDKIIETFEKPLESEVKLNTTFEKETPKKRKSSIKNASFTIENVDTPKETNCLNSTYEKTDSATKLNVTYEEDKDKRKSMRPSMALCEEHQTEKISLNSTFEKSKDSGHSSHNTTFDKETKLNSTFDKTDTQSKSNSTIKSSIISSDGTFNVTFDKSNERISITSDESTTENIVNTTPLLIESSIDESLIESTKESQSSEVQIKPPTTPLKREGTFTKDGPDIVMSPKPKLSTERTPVKRMSLPSPGSTPFPFSKSSQKEKTLMNVTRSIEKSDQRSSLAEAAPRLTRVMFCSPINNPAVVTQQKRKVIKSNLKGSNKSFVFDESATAVSEPARAAPRKRSYTHNDADDACIKRKRLAGGLQTSVDRLSRPRTVSATVKSSEPGTPSKKPSTPAKKTSPKTRSELKVSRTKLPNFAALHQRRFEKMESLDECQARKARRAKQLLTPTGAITVLERISPNTTKGPASTEPAKAVKDTKKTDTPTKAPKPPSLESLRPGFTRFGFKMNVENNPFSVPTKAAAKPKEHKPNGLLSRHPTQPSLAGASSRREIAKQAVMREKSFTSLSDKRDVTRKENRTTIKGVRTNRRFELQMRMRNINS